jgi:hypothetical protein
VTGGAAVERVSAEDHAAVRSRRVHGAGRDGYLSGVLADAWPRPAAAGAGD